MGAVQAQDYPGAAWGLALRTNGFDRAAIDEAFSAGQLLRTHVLRPTWHLVAPQDIRWLLALTGPRVLAGSAHRLRQLELDAATLRRSNHVLVKSLAGERSRTRRELGAALDAAGIPPSGQRLPYLLMHAELLGLVCSGPLRGREQTFALLDERVPPAAPWSRDEAVVELVRRYFASHGPATVHDFAWWSGLTVTDGRRGLSALGADAESMTIDGTTYWAAAATSSARAPDREPQVHLLPNFDELTVAYRDHAPSIDPRVLSTLPGAGASPGAGTGTLVLSNAVAVNGRVVGQWRRLESAAGTVLRLDLPASLSDAERDSMDAAATRFGAFLGRPVLLQGA
jgi:hypothetical protein